MQSYSISADEALKRLVSGNQKFVSSDYLSNDVAADTLLRFSSEGQKPYAIIITCSDSRVVPELIFSAGIGDLFVIRVAGNVIDSHQYSATTTAVRSMPL